MAESQQHTLDRVRKPRVHITYDVETGGAMEKKELPFLVGIMADLSGQPKEALPAMRERKFIDVDKDNLEAVMAKQTPRVAMKVDNKVTDEGGKLAVELNFKKMDDFSPAAVVNQVPALKALLEKRQKLEELLKKTDGNDKLDALLSEIINNADSLISEAKTRGIGEAKTEEAK